jgi:hypothetical protein
VELQPAAAHSLRREPSNQKETCRRPQLLHLGGDAPSRVEPVLESPAELRDVGTEARLCIGSGRSTTVMDEPVIERAEVVLLVFNVSDIERPSRGSNDCWKRTMAKKKLTEAERAEWEAQRAQMLANAQRTRELAELAQAKLDADAPRR